MKTDKAFGGDRVAPSGVVRSMSHSSRSTVLSKQEFASVKMLLDANEDVARHPDVRKQTFRVFRMLQNFSKRFSERGTALIDDDASSQSSEDPALAMVEDLLQRHSNGNFDGEGEEEIAQTVDSETTGDISASQDSSSGVIEDGNDKRPMVADGEVGAKIEPPTNDSLKELHRESSASDRLFGSCLLSSLCFLSGEANEEKPVVESVATATVPIDDAPPGLVFRVTDAFVEARNDDEGEDSMTRAVDEAVRTLQDSAPRQIDEHDYEEAEAEGGEVVRVRLGRGGPYDNLLRILHNIKQSQGEGRESPSGSPSSDPRDESEAKAPAKLWLSLDRHAWKVQDTE